MANKLVSGSIGKPTKLAIDLRVGSGSSTEEDATLDYLSNALVFIAALPDLEQWIVQKYASVTGISSVEDLRSNCELQWLNKYMDVPAEIRPEPSWFPLRDWGQVRYLGFACIRIAPKRNLADRLVSPSREPKLQPLVNGRPALSQSTKPTPSLSPLLSSSSPTTPSTSVASKVALKPISKATPSQQPSVASAVVANNTGGVSLRPINSNILAASSASSAPAFSSSALMPSTIQSSSAPCSQPSTPARSRGVQPSSSSGGVPHDDSESNYSSTDSDVVEFSSSGRPKRKAGVISEIKSRLQASATDSTISPPTSDERAIHRHANVDTPHKKPKLIIVDDTDSGVEDISEVFDDEGAAGLLLLSARVGEDETAQPKRRRGRPRKKPKEGVNTPPATSTSDVKLEPPIEDAESPSSSQHTVAAGRKRLLRPRPASSIESIALIEDAPPIAGQQQQPAQTSPAKKGGPPPPEVSLAIFDGVRIDTDTLRLTVKCLPRASFDHPVGSDWFQLAALRNRFKAILGRENLDTGLDDLDHRSRTLNFIVRNDMGKLVGSVRVVTEARRFEVNQFKEWKSHVAQSPGPWGEMGFLVIDEPFRGCGVARALIGVVLEHVGIRGVVCWVITKTQRDTLKRYGFKTICGPGQFVPSNANDEPEYVMAVDTEVLLANLLRREKVSPKK